MTMTSDRAQALQFTLGDRMKKALKVARLTRWDIADYLGVEPATVSSWMNDRIRPSKQTLILWAMQTEVSIGWLESGELEEVRPEGFEPPAYWSVAELEDLCPCQVGHEDPFQPCYCSCHGRVDEGLEARFWSIVAELEAVRA